MREASLVGRCARCLLLGITLIGGCTSDQDALGPEAPPPVADHIEVAGEVRDRVRMHPSWADQCRVVTGPSSMEFGSADATAVVP